MPTNLVMLALPAVASSYILRGGQMCCRAPKFLTKSWVSSANWVILCVVVPMVMPSNWSDAFMRRVRPSAMIRNARGENGQPWGTQHLRWK
jgi:hypothetical protein